MPGMSAAFRERYIDGKVAGRGAAAPAIVIPPTAIEAEELLAFEIAHETWPPRQKAAAIRRLLGLSSMAYAQQLNRLVDAVGDQADAEIPTILVRLRARRLEQRARRELQGQALRERLRR